MSRPSRPDADKHSARTLGGIIREGRRKKKLSQRQLAAELPMSQAHLSRIELGDHAPPSDELLLRIARLLELDPRVLLRTAGRQAAGATFEELVLDRLDALTGTIQQLQQTVARIESAPERRQAS